ncbi:hypothetical protein Hanom_Chr17g01524161 [Helianthus anomalus]
MLHYQEPCTHRHFPQVGGPKEWRYKAQQPCPTPSVKGKPKKSTSFDPDILRGSWISIGYPYPIRSPLQVSGILENLSSHDR